MVNWHFPALIAKDYLVVVKLDHVLGGVYIWEYVTSLDYEWSVLTGKRPYRWTVCVYTLCRLSALVAWAVLFAGLDSTGPINCRAWDTTFYTFAYISLASASFILLLRIYAIWERNVPVTGFCAAAWLASIALNIRSIAIGRSHHDPTSGACLNTNTHRLLTNAIGILVSDLVLLVFMLAGIRRCREARVFDLWKLLFHQGIAWLVLAAVGEIPTVIFVSFNLNDPWNLMFQPVELLMLAIGATRMYRGLADYGDLMQFSADTTRPNLSFVRASHTSESNVQIRRFNGIDNSSVAAVHVDASRDVVSLSDFGVRGNQHEEAKAQIRGQKSI